MKRNLAVVPGDDGALLAFLLVIATRDGTAAARALKAAPTLATATVQGGATREHARAFFLEDIKHHAYEGDTALHVAAAAYQPALAQALVACGAKVDARNRRGAAPLHYAADGGPATPWWNPQAQAAVVAFLIGAGTQPNVEDNSGVTPLHRAVRTRCTPAVTALLANGADACRRNKSGSTPLHLAVQDTGRGGAGSPEARDQQAAIIRVLLEHGASARDTDAKGKSVEASAGAEWIQALLRAG
jgi:ankyrin repeat protein